MTLVTAGMSSGEDGSCIEEVRVSGTTNEDANQQRHLMSGIDLGVTQNIDNERSQEVMARIEAAKEYVYHRIAMDPKKNKHLLDSCKLRNERCAYFAVTGTCDSDFMKTKCAPVCETCEKIPIDEHRCPIDLEKMFNAWKQARKPQ